MAIVGAHVLLYTSEAERLRETLRDVLGWDSVEARDPPDGWLIFKLPPAELAKLQPKGDSPPGIRPIKRAVTALRHCA